MLVNSSIVVSAESEETDEFCPNEERRLGRLGALRVVEHAALSDAALLQKVKLSREFTETLLEIY